MNANTCLKIAAICGFLAVLLGAFGAHGLKNLLKENNTVETWNTAVLYHFFHTLVLLALASRSPVSAGTVWSFVIGIALFSGSLYLVALTNIKWLGAITPFGGVAFLVGWVWMFFTASKTPEG